MKTHEENKARFFAQYWGQIISYPEFDNKITKARLTKVGFDEIETTYKRKKKHNHGYTVGDILSFESNGNHKCNALNAYLKLKSLADITDEDAIGISELLGLYAEDFDKGKEKQIDIGKSYIKDIIRGIRKSISVISVVDFLRSKGYALPYLDLTVEQQIQNGRKTKR